MPYHHFVSWADDTLCPDCHAADHMVARIFSCPRHPTNVAWGICGQHLSRTLSSWKIFRSFLISLHSRPILIPSLLNLNSRRGFLFSISGRAISSLVSQSGSAVSPSATQQQHQQQQQAKHIFSCTQE